MFWEQHKKTLYIILILTGAVLSLCFAPFYQIWLLPIVLPFLFWNLNQSVRRRSLFARSFCFGFGFGAVSTGWIAHAILLAGPSAIWLVPPAWIGMGILFGLFFGLPAVILSYFPVGAKRLWAWAALFTVFEWIRSWFLTGFPWNLMGSVWENTLPVLQSACIFGVYGLTFITILTLSTPALWPHKRPIIFGLSGLFVLWLFGSVRLHTATSDVVWGIQLRIVQPNIPQTLKWNPDEAEASFAKIRRLSRENNDKITHVIWPESSVQFLVNKKTDDRLLLMQAVRQGGILILGGMRAADKQKTIANSLFVLNDLGQIQAFYDKSHLVPFGEYVPFREILPLDKLVPLPFDFMNGSGVRTIRVPGTPDIGPLICYEVIFSGHVTDSKLRPAWLINVTNDGWYGLSAGPYQHLGMAKMRAVEEGLPLIRAANTGISAVFNAYGQTIGELALGTQGVLDRPLPVALPPTLYARFGIWIPIGFSFLILIFLSIRRK